MKKIVIIGGGISGLYIANLFRKNLDYDQKILFEIDYEPKKLKKFISKFNDSFGINYDSGNSASKGYIIDDEKINLIFEIVKEEKNGY